MKTSPCAIMSKIYFYSVKKKLDVIQWHKERGCMIHQTVEHFSTDRKQITQYITKKEILIVYYHEKNKHMRKLLTGKKPLSEDWVKHCLNFSKGVRKWFSSYEQITQ